MYYTRCSVTFGSGPFKTEPEELFSSDTEIRIRKGVIYDREGKVLGHIPNTISSGQCAALTRKYNKVFFDGEPDCVIHFQDRSDYKTDDENE